MTAEATVNQIINDQIATAEEWKQEAQSAADDAFNAASALTTPSAPPSIGSVTSELPAEPSVNLGDLFDSESKSKQDEIEAMVNTELASFLGTYFPCGFIGLGTTICNYIESSITNGGTGLPADVEAAIWDRGRNREQRLTERLSAEVAAVPASLGWPTAQGATLQRQRMAAQDDVNRDSTLSREIMIEQARLEQRNIHFCVQQGIGLWLGVMRAAQNFVEMKLRTYQLGDQFAEGLRIATENFYTQSLQFFQANAQLDQISLRYDASKVERDLDTSRLAADIIHKQASRKTEAAMAKARMLGDGAASALSTLNTMTSLINETVQESA